MHVFAQCPSQAEAWTLPGSEGAGDRDPPANAKCFAGDAEGRWGLSPFELCHLDEANDPIHDERILTTGDDGITGVLVLELADQNTVKNFIRRQAVLISLVGTQFSTGRFLDRGDRNTHLTRNRIDAT